MWLLLLACDPPKTEATDLNPSTGDLDTAAPTHAGDTDTPPPTQPPVPASSCDLGAHELSFTLTLMHAGELRTAVVDLPADYDGTRRLPVVLNFHGLLMSGDLQRSYTGMHVAANDRGWISVHPNGVGLEWDLIPPYSDVSFVEALLDVLDSEVCIDTSRTYATGLSNGDYMSYIVGCAIPERIAAIAPVAGMNLTGCQIDTEVPLLHIHGTADLIVPYLGVFVASTAPQSVEDWASGVNDCAVAPTPTAGVGTVSCESRSCSMTSESTLCTVGGGGHTWPGAAPNALLGPTNTDIDANDVILDFFERWSR